MDPVVVVGAGMAGGRAFDVFRKSSTTPVLLVGDEPHRPYHRPELSKRFLLDGSCDSSIFFHPPEHYARGHANFLASSRAVALEPDVHLLTLADGTVLTYSKLLIATGGTPRTMDVPGTQLEGIHYLRSLEDARILRETLSTRRRLAVIGAGLVGLEVAAAASGFGLEVTVVDVCQLPFPRLGEELGQRLVRLHEDHGVRFLLGTTVVRFTGDTRIEGVELDNGTILAADAAIIGIGIVPDTVWLAPVLAGRLVKGTVAVDELGRTGLPDVYAVGDVTTWSHPYFGPVHSEHETVAQNHGMRIASGLVRDAKPFAMVPYAWSDQYDHELRTVGIADVTLSDDVTIVEGHAGAVAALYLRERDILGAAALDWSGFVARVSKAMQSQLPLPCDSSLVRALVSDPPTP